MNVALQSINICLKSLPTDSRYPADCPWSFAVISLLDGDISGGVELVYLNAQVACRRPGAFLEVNKVYLFDIDEHGNDGKT